MGCRFRGALVVVVALAVAVAIVVAGGRAEAYADVGAGDWVRPVEGAVVRGFDPPRSRFGAGHLGADLAAPRGTPVVAAGAGVVSFAGRVAGALHVVVAHAGGLRTSYSFLASVTVRRGERVAAGDPLGTAGGTGGGHNGSVVHFGLRAGDAYIDPMGLFRPLDLAAVVHLAPTTGPPRPLASTSERRGLLDGLARGAGALGHAVVIGIDAAGHAIARAASAQVPVAAATMSAGAELVGDRGRCDSAAPDANGEGGSGHRAMVVAGIDSSRAGAEPSLALPVSKLGYQPGEVSYFSYSGRHDYTAADTEGPIMLAARRLGEQLRAMQVREPGREVDLLAHSQGGVVVEAFLTLIYKRNDRSYPPLGTVVTLSSPLRGDPLATAAAAVGRTAAGDLALEEGRDALRAAGLDLPLRSPALRDLAAGSELMRRLDAARLPDEVELTTIGAATDVVVPGNAATRAGARSTTIISHGLNAHPSIVDDPTALRVVRSALENKPLPCQSLATRAAGKLIPIVISALEERVGTVGHAVGQIMDGSP